MDFQFRQLMEKNGVFFYKRAKIVIKFFELTEKMDKDYLTDIAGQT